MRTFHWGIVAYFLICILGCGYKTDPYWGARDSAFEFKGMIEGIDLAKKQSLDGYALLKLE